VNPREGTFQGLLFHFLFLVCFHFEICSLGFIHQINYIDTTIVIMTAKEFRMIS